MFPTLFTGARLAVRILSADEDLPAVEAFCARCQDYYELQLGEPPDPAGEARQIFEEVPANTTSADKIVLGAFDASGQLRGLLEVLRGYREPADWYIGLLLLDPVTRGQGAGRALHEEFSRWAQTQGVERLLLAVLGENIRAKQFWRAQGYRTRAVFPPRRMGRKSHVLIEMELELPHGSSR